MKEKVTVLWFMGQSNMQGQTERLPDENPDIDGAFEYRYFTDSLKPLNHPCGESILRDMKEGWFVPGQAVADQIREWQKAHALGGASGKRACMLPAFCKAFIAEYGGKVVAVHTAKGATLAKEWLPPDSVFFVARTKMQAAVNKIKENFEIDKIHILWLQGESDAIAKTPKDVYEKQLREIKDNATRDFGVDKFGIIKVGEFALNGFDEVIFEAQEELCRTYDDFLMVTRITEDLIKDRNYLNPFARGHYNCDGQEKIGLYAGTNFALMLKGEKPRYK